MVKYNNLVKQYLVKYQNELGDLTTYNENKRILEFIDEPYKVKFSIGWLRNQNEPDLLEIHMVIYNTTIPVKKCNIVIKAWIYKNGNDWDIQLY